MKIRRVVAGLAWWMLVGARLAAAVEPTGLERQLLAEPPSQLAAAARGSGDATRGAIVFHQPHMACQRCHLLDGKPEALGPDLTALPVGTTDEQIIEAVLVPSKVIRKGFETTLITTIDGRSLVGVVVESTPELVVLRDASQPGKKISIPADEIEERKSSDQSVMPASQVNQLASRQQFLDLVKYLIELRDGGRDRARQLQPSPALIALEVPEYEQRIDHAGILRDLDSAALRRGEAIYQRLCVNCHGTREQPGSLPTSLRFATGKFKSGSDPFTMYQTLTRGFGLMTPQAWMVPRQKYDVIHYIRETYLKPHNASQYVPLDDKYLASLPRGTTRGPAPSTFETWSAMDYGPTLIGTYETGSSGANFAYKGIAMRLDPGPGGIARGRHWMTFDHDTLRVAAAWSGTNFIDWQGIHFDGRHNAHPHVAGAVTINNPSGPGWADPATGSFADQQRVVGRDGRRYGPLPRTWGRYRGLYHHGDRAIVSYDVGDTPVLESAGIAILDAKPGSVEPPAFTRTLQIGPRSRPLVMLVATASEDVALTGSGAVVRLGPPSVPSVLAGLQGDARGLEWAMVEKRLCLKIPAGDQPLRFGVWMARESAISTVEQFTASLSDAGTPPDLDQFLHGGPPRWPQPLTAAVQFGADDGPFAVDVLAHPQSNPWFAQLRLTGLDFLPGGDRVVVCAWDGDVWLVEGLKSLNQKPAKTDDVRQATLTWRRIASGLFQPLGIKWVDGQIFVTCRDQLVVLRDLNGDGETDFYQCWNNDHQVTEHFHEFAMGLQVDAQGDFYYAKSARHALPALVPHHGTLLKISRDGATTEILANGFRAANGVCLNPDGSFVVTDQEGHWNPKNRINWVTRGGFYGNMFGYHDVTDASDGAMRQPLCWITNAFDRSPAELLWTPRDAWGPLGGSLLNLSYGYGRVFVVPFEEIDGQKQGGMCALPIPALPTGVMRGRFHPDDQQLYACGMFAWAGSATQPGGFYRLRYTGRAMHLPTSIQAKTGRLEITMTDPVDRASATNTTSYAVKTWSLKRSADYGSKHYDEKPLQITAAELSADGRTITLRAADLSPTWGMEIACRLRSTKGERFERVIHNSVFRIGE